MAKRSAGSGGGRVPPRLPKQQLGILALCRFAEPVAMTSVYPYIPEMIKSFHVPPKSVAKWAGLLSLVFSLSQALVGIAWGRASDKIGRKPMILLALTCTMISSVTFGFSSSLVMAFVTRSMQGLSNGNVGIIRTAVAELVPQKELQPRAFSIMPLVWTIGSIFGPAFGGSLVYPAERFPAIFGRWQLFKDYPFALPNMLISMLFMIGITTGILFLKESLDEKKSRKDYGLILGSQLTRPCRRSKRPKWYNRDSEESEAFLGPGASSVPTTPVVGKAPKLPEQNSGWAQVFSRQSSLNLAVYTFLAMHSVSFDQLLPVFLDYSPVQTINDPKVKLPLKFAGGFDLDSGRIGALFTIYGIFGMVIQFVVFPPVVRRFGVLRSFKVVALTFPLVYMALPYTSLLPTNQSRQGATLFLMLIKCVCAIFAFPCSTILLTNSATSLKVLGTLNGVATSISALGRAAGPALAGAMFSLGADLGYMIMPWWTLAVIAVIGAVLVFFLVESEGFGGPESDDEVEFDCDSDEEAIEEVDMPPGTARTTGTKAAPVDVTTVRVNEGETMGGPSSALSRTSTRTSRGGTRRQSFTPHRMASPVGMGPEGVASGAQRRFSTDLGTTNSGFGTGGTSYH